MVPYNALKNTKESVGIELPIESVASSVFGIETLLWARVPQVLIVDQRKIFRKVRR